MSTASTTFSWDPPEVTSGTTTSWIPLTTAWPSSSGCASSFFQYHNQPFPVAWDPGYGFWASGTARCLPPAATTWWEQGALGGDGFSVLSIRPIVCPAAFTTAATSIQSGSSTAVRCCPSGYDLQGGEPGHLFGKCESPLTSGQTIEYIQQTAGIGYAVSTIVTSTLTITSSTTASAIAILGWNVNTPTGSNVVSPASSVNASTSNVIPATSSTSASGNGLSAGAKAGIGVGVAGGALGLLAFIAALWLLKRRPIDARYGPVSGSAGPQQQHAASGRSVHELVVPNKVHEMDPNTPPVEVHAQEVH